MVSKGSEKFGKPSSLVLKSVLGTSKILVSIVTSNSSTEVCGALLLQSPYSQIVQRRAFQAGAILGELNSNRMYWVPSGIVS